MATKMYSEMLDDIHPGSSPSDFNESPGKAAVDMFKGGATGVATTGLSMGVASLAGVPSEAIQMMLPSILFNSVSRGIVTGPAKATDPLEATGAVGKWASGGQTLGGIAGTFSPFGPIAGLFGRTFGGVVGDAVGDALDLREGELFRDLLEDQNLSISDYAKVDLSGKSGTERDVLELEKLALLRDLGEGKEEEKKEPGYFDKMGTSAATYLNSAMEEIFPRDMPTPSSQEVRDELKPGDDFFGGDLDGMSSKPKFLPVQEYYKSSAANQKQLKQLGSAAKKLAQDAFKAGEINEYTKGSIIQYSDKYNLFGTPSDYLKGLAMVMKGDNPVKVEMNNIIQDVKFDEKSGKLVKKYIFKKEA